MWQEFACIASAHSLHQNSKLIKIRTISFQLLELSANLESRHNHFLVQAIFLLFFSKLTVQYNSLSFINILKRIRFQFWRVELANAWVSVVNELTCEISLCIFIVICISINKFKKWYKSVKSESERKNTKKCILALLVDGLWHLRWQAKLRSAGQVRSHFTFGAAWPLVDDQVECSGKVLFSFCMLIYVYSEVGSKY